MNITTLGSGLLGLSSAYFLRIDGQLQEVLVS